MHTVRQKITVAVFAMAVAGLCPAGAHAQSSGSRLVTAVHSRTAIDLNGDWASIVDPFENGYYSYRLTPLESGYFADRQMESPRDLIEYDFNTSDRLHVPGDWNSQDDRLFFYEGTVWYRRHIELTPDPGRRYVLHFGAVNYEASVYLNGQLVGSHVGGFTPFQFEITDRLLQGRNVVVVKVDNARRRDGVPTVNTDWWNYGGITRDVRLLDLPATYIRDVVVQLDPRDASSVVGHVRLDGPDRSQEVSIAVAGREHRVETGADGVGRFRFDASGLPLWSPESPSLLDVTVTSAHDRVMDRIGFRTVETRGQEILLNGEPVYLRGISLHEVAPLREGRATTMEDARVLLGWAKELGCNFVRLAHYPHNEHMVRAADEMGLMLWSEIPVYWTILWEDADVLANAESQLTEMIVRDRNRASIVIWSVANETPRGDARLRFLSHLTDRARALDPTRLLSAATELSYDGRRISVDDPLGEHLDVLGVNQYLGWYSAFPEDIASFSLDTPYDKPVIISEFGAGAKFGLRGDKEHRWTEEYQAEVYREQVKLLDGVPFVRGMTPWILTDFRSPRRHLPVVQDFWNRKGLISEKGERKLAFGVLQDYYRSKAGVRNR